MRRYQLDNDRKLDRAINGLVKLRRVAGAGVPGDPAPEGSSEPEPEAVWAVEPEGGPADGPEGEADPILDRESGILDSSSPLADPESLIADPDVAEPASGEVAAPAGPAAQAEGGLVPQCEHAPRDASLNTTTVSPMGIPFSPADSPPHPPCGHLLPGGEKRMASASAKGNAPGRAGDRSPSPLRGEGWGEGLPGAGVQRGVSASTTSAAAERIPQNEPGPLAAERNPENEPDPPVAGDLASRNELAGPGPMAGLGVPALVCALLILLATGLPAAFAGPIGQPSMSPAARAGPAVRVGPSPRRRFLVDEAGQDVSRALWSARVGASSGNARIPRGLLVPVAMNPEASPAETRMPPDSSGCSPSRIRRDRLVLGGRVDVPGAIV
jgi:hypothetical protein